MAGDSFGDFASAELKPVLISTNLSTTFFFNIFIVICKQGDSVALELPLKIEGVDLYHDEHR